MKPVEKAVLEVRAWKKKVGARTRGMSVREAVSYFRAARKRLPRSRRKAA